MIIFVNIRVNHVQILILLLTDLPVLFWCTFLFYQLLILKGIYAY
uniref:Uncharacterized protein n=1 Tax=Arundo donax TaxID=35708 RepID=A0A0A8YS70_ARUDO